MNARTSQGVGPSALNIAKESLGPDHAVCLFLTELGAEDWEDEYEGDDDEEGEEEDGWEDDDDDYGEDDEEVYRVSDNEL